jgi:hypothetical protein
MELILLCRWDITDLLLIVRLTELLLRVFMFAGASVHPGGMVILGPGYNCAKVVCEDLGVDFKWEEHPTVKEAKKRGYL